MERVCQLLSNGGFGLRDLIINDRVLMMKFAYNIATKETFVYLFLHSRYMSDNLAPPNLDVLSSIWPRVEQLFIELIRDSRWIVIDIFFYQGLDK